MVKNKQILIYKLLLYLPASAFFIKKIEEKKIMKSLNKKVDMDAQKNELTNYPKE